MQKIAVFGGTFNPIHNGHLNLCLSCHEQLDFDKILLIPANIPPHKVPADLAGKEDRLAMCRLAVEDNPLFEVSDTEFCRKGVSYTVDTIAEIKQEYPNAELYLIIGSDMLYMFHQWYQFETILKKAVIVAGARQEKEYARMVEYRDSLGELGNRITIIRSSVLAVSSTEVRQAVEAGTNLSQLVPDKVIRYIEQNKLYQLQKGNRSGKSFAELNSLVKSSLSKKRYLHSKAVAQKAVELAGIYGADTESAYAAGILHDLTKENDLSAQLKTITDSAIIKDTVILNSKSLYHAVTAYLFAKEQLGIKDEEVLCAIRYHTTARAGMSLLEKIIYIADKISEDRKYPDAERYRNLAQENLDKCLFAILADTLVFLLSKRRLIPLDTIEAYNELCSAIKDR